MRLRIPDELVDEHIEMIKEKTGEVVSKSEGYRSMASLINTVKSFDSVF